MLSAIGTVLFLINILTWIRILSMRKMIGYLDGILNMRELRERLSEYSLFAPLMKWLFLRKNEKALTKGEWFSAVTLILFYIVLIPYVIQLF